MKFQFKIQPYQTDAVAAVVGVFSHEFHNETAKQPIRHETMRNMKVFCNGAVTEGDGGGARICTNGERVFQPVYRNSQRTGMSVLRCSALTPVTDLLRFFLFSCFHVKKAVKSVFLRHSGKLRVKNIRDSRTPTQRRCYRTAETSHFLATKNTKNHRDNSQQPSLTRRHEDHEGTAKFFLYFFVASCLRVKKSKINL